MPTSSSTVRACSAVIGSSSTTSTFSAPGSISRSVPDCSQLRRLTITVNSVPTPFSDSTSIVPFIISTRFFVIAIPSPVLPYLLLRLPSSWAKASNTLGMKSRSMPMPVSWMQNFIVDWSPNTAVRSTVSVMLPGASVNLTALLRMLISTSFSFMASPM